MCHRPIPHRLRRLAVRRRSEQEPAAPPAEGPKVSEPSMADEAEAFVNGELAELLSAAGRSHPPWLALNRLGHAAPQVLARAVAGDHAAGGLGHDHGWAEAERSLARRLLNGHRDPNDVRRVQRAVLVPLELRLIAESRVRALTVGQVLARAADALDEHQSRGPRS